MLRVSLHDSCKFSRREVPGARAARQGAQHEKGDEYLKSAERFNVSAEVFQSERVKFPEKSVWKTANNGVSAVLAPRYTRARGTH